MPMRCDGQGALSAPPHHTLADRRGMHIAVRRYATWHPRPPVPIVSNRQARRRHRVLGLGSLGPQPVLRAIHDPAPPEITGESRRR